MPRNSIEGNDMPNDSENDICRKRQVYNTFLD